MIRTTSEKLGKFTVLFAHMRTHIVEHRTTGIMYVYNYKVMSTNNRVYVWFWEYALT